MHPLSLRRMHPSEQHLLQTHLLPRSLSMRLYQWWRTIAGTGWAPVGFLAVITLLGRVPGLFVHYWDWDEATVMAQAWAMTQGQVLHRDIYQIHPLLNFALIVPFFQVFPPEWVPLAVKTMNLCLVFLGALLVRRIALGWLGSGPLALLGGCVFVYYCSRLWASTAYGEFYTVFPILLTVWLLYVWTGPRRVAYYATGFLWGVAFFLKQSAAFDAIGLYLGYLWLSRESKTNKTGATGLLACGFLSLTAVTAMYFVYHGALVEAWHSVVVRTMTYTSSGGRWYYLLKLARGLTSQLAPSLPAIAGVIYVVFHRGRPGGGKLNSVPFFLVLLIWFCADLVGLAAYGRFYPNYVLPLVPAASLLPLFFLGQMEVRLGRAAGISVLVALALVVSMDFANGMLELRGERWVPLSVRQSQAAAEFIKSHTRPDDRIFIYRAYNVDVFFLSQRLPNNGIYQYHDMTAKHTHDPAHEARKQAEFVSNLPAIIVVNPALSEAEEPRVEFFEKVLRKHYSLAATREGIRLYARIHPSRETD